MAVAARANGDGGTERLAWPGLLLRVALRRRRAIPTGQLDCDRHLRAAASWILAAAGHAPGGGIPAGFRLVGGRWAAPYPETSGYTIPTLCACADALQDDRLAGLAVGLARWLRSVQTAEGGVRSWEDPDGPPIVFDTGQVIFGWVAAWHQTSDPAYLEAAEHAADWLVRIQSESGAWTEHQHNDMVKVIDTRVAWALLALAEITSRPAYTDGARRALDWALGQQAASGWFHHATFRSGEQPSTHALAYAARGLLESGILLREARYVQAAEKTAWAILECQRADGSLAARYDCEWRARSRSSCLTGNCQMALLWLRLCGLSREPRLLGAARRAIAFVASTQDLGSLHPGLRGGIAGSYPIYGSYARLQYPNWAAKFFADALLALRRVDRPDEPAREWPG